MATGKKITKLNRVDYEECDISLIKISDIQSVYTEKSNNYYIIIQQSTKNNDQSVIHSYLFGTDARYNIFGFIANICNKINEVRKKNEDDYLLILRHRDNPRSYKDVYLLSEVEFIL